ncbi:MAG TPA: hypothetical protein VKB90_11545 [Candidatus Acidoferrum sp.]|nr:hypothetical protein [Candidatus Acidoferrum sp.]
MHFGRTASARSPAVCLSLALLALSATACASPAIQRHDWPTVPPVSLTPPPGPPVIVVGFVGGVVKPDDPIRGEVKLAEHLRAEFPSGVYVETFENRRRETALQVILTHLGADRSGLLSENEKRQARIILYGHSWGGAAMLELARELDRRKVPVLLTVQVDSVKRFRTDDSVIPPNVARAANFYQPNGMIHGQEEIRAANPTKTQILGNFRFNYKEHPLHCKEYPWYDRTFAKTHTEIDCDPAVWSRVEALIRQQIPPGNVN